MEGVRGLPDTVVCNTCEPMCAVAVPHGGADRAWLSRRMDIMVVGSVAVPPAARVSLCASVTRKPISLNRVCPQGAAEEDGLWL